MSWLSDDIIDAIVRAKPDMKSWGEMKKHELSDSDRMEVLTWICCSLDAENRRIAADLKGLDPDDLLATRRVLQKFFG